jgi:hypothetical protein
MDSLWHIHYIDPVIHRTDAAAVFRMPVTESPRFDYLLARAARRDILKTRKEKP